MAMRIGSVPADVLQPEGRLYFDGQQWHQLSAEPAADASIESLATAIARLDDESLLRLAEALFERTGQRLGPLDDLKA